MSLTLVRGSPNQALWEACADRFLAEIGDATGPDGFPSMLWIAHRGQRDALFERAAARGVRGWLNPPVRFLSELPAEFAIDGRPIGALARRLLVSRVAEGVAARVGFARGRGGSSAGRGLMLDPLFGELLPEGVTTDALAEALSGLEGDSFTRNRNAWICETYTAYLSALAERGRYDPRAIHGLIGREIERGGLPDVLGGARRLHIYGVYSPRARRRLFGALAGQTEVAVFIYLPASDAADEWDSLDADVEHLAATRKEGRPGAPAVQPAPDAIRELDWVAREVKRLLVNGDAEPHEVAVVARSGRDDTLRAYRTLRRAGIPATARIRTPLAEVPALKALIELFRGTATGWPYRPLRHVLGSPYLAVDPALGTIDAIAADKRVAGLAGWTAELERLRGLVGTDSEWKLRRKGLSPERLGQDLTAFAEFVDAVSGLEERRSQAAWIRSTLALLRGERFGFRRLLCRPVTDRWDVVRLDQRGVLQLEALLHEWAEFGDDEDDLGPAEWYARLRRLLAGNELALSTPAQKGVQILEAHEAALSPFTHTFLIHANDGEFPRRVPVGGVLTDEERAALQTLGLPVTGREVSLERERSLWRAVTNAPNVRIAYRTTDANGTPRLPSLFVPPHEQASELPRSHDPRTEPINEEQALLYAAEELARHKREGDSGPVRTPSPERVRHAVLAAYAESCRGSAVADPGDAARLGANGWNGQMRDPAVLRELRRRFGRDYAWSASQLERYALCPFFFFMDKVLRLDEYTEAEEETTPLTFGGVAHTLLERFYATWEHDPPDTLDASGQEVLRTVTETVFSEYESREEWLGLPPLWGVTKTDVRDAVESYLRWELEHASSAGERPHLIEYSFGPYGGTGTVVVTGEDLSGQSQTLRLNGRIDRVDEIWGPNGPRYRVLDYKTKRIPAKAGYRDGVLLQAPLYMKVLADHLGLPIESGEYRAIKDPRPRTPLNASDPAFERALRIAFSIPERVRTGLFEAIYAASERSWRSWDPGREVCRTEARLEDGSRFDE